MAKRSQWRFRLFLLGAALSIALAIFQIVCIAKGAIGDISWAFATIIIGATALPLIALGAPYFNSKFLVSYSKETGLKIEEQDKAKKECECKP